MSIIKKASEVKEGDIVQNARGEIYAIVFPREAQDNSKEKVNGFIALSVTKNNTPRIGKDWHASGDIQNPIFDMRAKNRSLSIKLRTSNNLFKPEDNYRIDMNNFIGLFAEPEEFSGGDPNDPNVEVLATMSAANLKKFKKGVNLLVIARTLDPKTAMYLLDARAKMRNPAFKMEDYQEVQQMRYRGLLSAIYKYDREEADEEFDISLDDALAFDFITKEEYQDIKAALGNQATGLVQSVDELYEKRSSHSDDIQPIAWQKRAEKNEELMLALFEVVDFFNSEIKRAKESLKNTPSPNHDTRPPPWDPDDWTP